MNRILITIRLASMPCLFLLLLSLSGCGVKHGAVTGKVTYDGKPLPAGTVTFYMPSGKVETAQIQSEGEYTCHLVEVGHACITVQTPSFGARRSGKIFSRTKAARQGDLGKKGNEMPRVSIVPIPSRYNDPETSGLTLDVTDTGQHTFDIALTP